MVKNKSKNVNGKYFYTGLAISVIIVISYFIPMEVEEGTNYIVNTSLLGIIIFHNPFVLALYLLVSIWLVVKGIVDRK